MRTIDEIKEAILVDFMTNEDAARLYGFPPGDNFYSHFSKVSVESVLFYVFSAAAWVLENLFESHKSEIDARIAEVMPHRPRWYRNKALNYMSGWVLIPGTDLYDTTQMSPEEIAAAKVVKYAVASEDSTASKLTIKVAGESGGERCKLDGVEEKQLEVYLGEIKDAGVRIDLVNLDADKFSCEVDIYYNPITSASEVETRCKEAVKSYLEGLDFDGEYTHMALVDEFQKVNGVKVVELKQATVLKEEKSHLLGARYTPDAGYLKVDKITINTQVYE